ncbi:hypothetical protein BCEN4_370016 [Burkholderia cenocepacia]|nr:hypothetical protein BCEN4_370016 [Burkholderia cenocepacia]
MARFRRRRTNRRVSRACAGMPDAATPSRRRAPFERRPRRTQGAVFITDFPCQVREMTHGVNVVAARCLRYPFIPKLREAAGRCHTNEKSF